MVGFDELTKCGNCGKDVYGLEVFTYIKDIPICETCAELFHKNPDMLNKYKTKQRRKELFTNIRKHLIEMSNGIFMFFAYILIVTAFVAFVCLWVGGCVGNFLNVDESPIPGLHWKP